MVLITLNAGEQLADCLASVAGWASEIVLVDSGSSDKTLFIAAQYGARVIQQTWLGFGAQKQFAVQQAQHDWVLCLDADERVTPILAESIQRLMQQGPTAPAYAFARCNRFMGRYLRHGEGYPDRSLRLFDRRAAAWTEDAVHEQVRVFPGVSLPVGWLAGDLNHDSAEDLSRYLEKQNRYTTLAAEAALAQGKRVSLGRLILSPWVRFIKFYLVRQGFRDGVPGLVHILMGCYNSFSKYAKMLERQTKG